MSMAKSHIDAIIAVSYNETKRKIYFPEHRRQKWSIIVRYLKNAVRKKG